MTAAKQLVMSLMKEIIDGKKQRGIVPAYALATEINDKVKEALNELVKEKAVSFRPASVNKIPAFFLPEQNK